VEVKHRYDRSDHYKQIVHYSYIEDRANPAQPITQLSLAQGSKNFDYNDLWVMPAPE
jgi:hypothetical protein